MSATTVVLGGLVLGAAAVPASAARASQSASLAGITVHSLPVNAVNWTPAAGFGSRRPGWYTDKSGIVHLQGAAKQFSASGSKANLLATLPKAARPSRALFFIVHTFAGTYADLAIATNGKISLINPRPPAVKDFSFVSLEGITFKR